MITLSDARKTFGTLVAVNGLSFEIRRGEIFGLLGPNGAGKTTTVNMIVGLLQPDAGIVAIDGQSPVDPLVRRRLGVATQALSLYDELTGEENVAFFGRIQGLRGDDLAKRVREAIEFVSLWDRRKDRVKTYSGGMKRRINLAIAIVHRPEVLLLDEPTVGVDPQSRNAIFEKIRELNAKGLTVLYTTHYMEEAQRLCHRVGVMDSGKLLALDTVDQLITTHGGKSVLVAQQDDGELRIDTDDPFRELDRLHRGGKLRSFRVDRPDLETVFLNLTGRQLRD